MRRRGTRPKHILRTPMLTAIRILTGLCTSANLHLTMTLTRSGAGTPQRQRSLRWSVNHSGTSGHHGCGSMKPQRKFEALTRFPSVVFTLTPFLVLKHSWPNAREAVTRSWAMTLKTPVFKFRMEQNLFRVLTANCNKGKRAGYIFTKLYPAPFNWPLLTCLVHFFSTVVFQSIRSSA